jgi:LacI family transcriptional regulator
MSTVEQPALEIGQIAAEHLFNMIEGKQKIPQPGTVKIPTRMVIRESSQRSPVEVVG